MEPQRAQHSFAGRLHDLRTLGEPLSLEKTRSKLQLLRIQVKSWGYVKVAFGERLKKTEHILTLST